MQLAAADEALVASPAGRQQLQRDLTRVINQVLRERTGFGGIDNVYFTSFVVQ
jgi:flagellar FliL protein